MIMQRPIEPKHLRALGVGAGFVMLTAISLAVYQTTFGHVHSDQVTQDFLPHGYCFLWQPGLLWLHIISDMIIASAYFSIPLTLIYFVHKRDDLPFNWMFLCFGIFIVACGLTHIFDIWTLWYPNYWLSGTTKLITAGASISTSVLLVRIIPKVLTLPSPDDLQRANQALRDQKAMLQSILNSMGEGVVVFDQQGQLVLSNPASKRILGKQSAEAGAVHQASAEQMAHSQPLMFPFTNAIQGKTIDGAELVLATPDLPESRWLNVSARPCKAGGNIDLGTVVVFRDITEQHQAEAALRQAHDDLEQRVAARTAELAEINAELRAEIAERKRTEAALQESEAHFRALVEGIEDYAIYMLDPSGRVVSWNAGAERTTGYQAAEVIGRHFSCFYTDYDIRQGLPEQALLKAQQMGRYEDEGWRMRKGGSRFWANTVLTAIYDEQAQLRGFAKLTHDATERKWAEEALHQSKQELETRVAERTAELRESESTLRSFFDSTALMMGIIELVEDDIIHISDNTATAQFLSRMPEDMRHQPASLLGIPPQVVKLLIEQCRDSDRTNGPMKFEHIYETSLGQRCLSITVSPIRPSVSDRARFAYVAEDVTERRHSEERITLALREKEVLLQEIHHRVKNNLQVISSLLKLQSNSITDPQALEVFQESQNRVRSMALVHEQLYQAKDLAQIDFADYLKQLTTYLFRSYNVTRGNISFEISADPIRLHVEQAVPLGLIVNELVSNALKYAFPEARVGKLWIGLRATGDEHLTLTVSDNGVGFPHSIDFRIAETLGLRLVTMLTKQVGGAIALDTSQGTQFTLTI